LLPASHRAGPIGLFREMEIFMSTTLSPRPFPIPSGTRLLGEVISWTCPTVSVKFPALLEALRSAELDESVARALQPRQAFSRACRKLSDSRIIRQVGEDEHHLTFQFTAESRHGDTFEYTLETLLRLDKQTGIVSCHLTGLAQLAQEHLDHALENRNGTDITRVIQRLFDRQADLFPIRDQGGIYFVAERFGEFVDRVQKLVSAVGGRLARFPVPAGTPHGDRSVQDAVADGLSAVIAEHRAAVMCFGEDTRESTIRRAAERVRATRFKLEAYGDLLLEERSRLERELADAAQALRDKVAALSETSAGSPAGSAS
jgi:hypothetical protein